MGLNRALQNSDVLSLDARTRLRQMSEKVKKIIKSKSRLMAVTMTAIMKAPQKPYLHHTFMRKWVVSIHIQK